MFAMVLFMLWLVSRGVSCFALLCFADGFFYFRTQVRVPPHVLFLWLSACSQLVLGCGHIFPRVNRRFCW
ncbi:hypothetical protein FN846DRAFT_931508 [Sphaerosporella brunnea]|uniref:Secreted protein n=1 Tax=Sphaerosporella brunnea TaxID=1250544 RepID=A0A5J5F7T5_9PEZI|nr:hypothetical protein FN846DRAFT_931508 [Sphaerosporella brunnea]